MPIHPREISSKAMARLTRSAPMPPWASGMVSPNRPMSAMPATISVG
jgi:hypothetical protein